MTNFLNWKICETKNFQFTQEATLCAAKGEEEQRVMQGGSVAH